ncbi:MAG: hypothetical protein LBR43_03770 [Spiroplasmataceae bacterium]|nr:hypothetical protein [Spiroplasmataceae bacterium]
MPTSLKDQLASLNPEERTQFLKEEQIRKSQNFKPTGKQAEKLARITQI